MCFEQRAEQYPANASLSSDLATFKRLVQALAIKIAKRSDAVSISHTLAELYLLSFRRVQNIRADLDRRHVCQSMADTSSRQRMRAAHFALKDEGKLLQPVDLALRGIGECLGMKPRMIKEIVSRIGQMREPTDGPSEEALDRIVGAMLGQTNNSASTVDPQPLVEKYNHKESSCARNSMNGAPDQRGELVRAVAESITDETANPLATAHLLSEIYLDRLRRLVDLYAAFNEARQLEAAGDHRGKAKYRQVRLALKEEGQYLCIVDQAVRGVSYSTGLKVRLGMQSRAGPVDRRSHEELTAAAMRHLVKVMCERAKWFNMPIPRLSKIADEAGVDLDIPREGERK